MTPQFVTREDILAYRNDADGLMVVVDLLLAERDAETQRANKAEALAQAYRKWQRKNLMGRRILLTVGLASAVTFLWARSEGKYSIVWTSRSRQVLVLTERGEIILKGKILATDPDIAAIVLSVFSGDGFYERDHRGIYDER